MYFYSFAKNPLDYEPSGSLNASRLDNLKLRFKFPAKLPNGEPYPQMFIRVYATNIHTIRIMSGMGGLAFSK